MWKATAEVYADPELHAALKRDSGEDYGPVPEPDRCPAWRGNPGDQSRLAGANHSVAGRKRREPSA